jgi:hypothetical protein
MIAPATSLLVWCQGRATQIGVDRQRPDVDLPGQGAWPEAMRVAPFSFRVPGTTEVIVQRLACQFGTPARPGDRITATSELVNCSARKNTKLGPGYFVTGMEVYRNQRDEIIGRVALTLLQYGGKTRDAPAGRGDR